MYLMLFAHLLREHLVVLPPGGRSAKQSNHGVVWTHEGANHRVVHHHHHHRRRHLSLSPPPECPKGRVPIARAAH
uniref:Putative secreted protein n=1 Tax=Anopheles marajoara TaxID=58244 RepID=A0A2M4CD24_9DIPT